MAHQGRLVAHAGPQRGPDHSHMDIKPHEVVAYDHTGCRVVLASPLDGPRAVGVGSAPPTSRETQVDRPRKIDAVARECKPYARVRRLTDREQGEQRCRIHRVDFDREEVEVDCRVWKPTKSNQLPRSPSALEPQTPAGLHKSPSDSSVHLQIGSLHVRAQR
eukprot:6075654-Prymnesium_polylepis.1